MMKKYPYETPIIWHVCFSKEKKWWAGKYSHAHLAGYSDGTWFNLDLHLEGVSSGMLYTHDDVTDYLSFLLTHFDVVRFGPVRSRATRFARPLTCVSFIKHFLGVRSGALRPDGLFRTLVEEYDGVFLNEDARDQRDGCPDRGAETG